MSVAGSAGNFTPSIEPMRAGPYERKRAPPGAPFDHRYPAVQFSGTFLPFLYWYSVIAGFFSSPFGSNAIFAVTPW